MWSEEGEGAEGKCAKAVFEILPVYECGNLRGMN